MIRRIIFDMDGLLVHTEKVDHESYAEVLHRYGISLTKEAYDDLWIRRGKGIADYVRENKLNLNPDKLRLEKKEIYQNRIKKELIVFEGAKEKLEELYKNYPLALVTSSYRSDVDLILEISGLKKYFGIVVTGTDVKEPKPDPEGLLMVNYVWNDVWGESWQGSPQDILVVGDGEKDINAAYAAGMNSIAIPNECVENNDFSNADAILRCISDISPELISNL